MRVTRGHGEVYEINTLVWLDELSRKYGREITLGSVPDIEIDYLKGLGFDYIWLMGVWKRSAFGRDIFVRSPEFQAFLPAFDNAFPGWRLDDLAGSPYSIAAYEIEPSIGTWDDISRFKKSLNDRDMGLILDFVPNHTAPDHPWVATNPDFYLQGSEDDFIENPLHFTPIEIDGKTLFFARGRDPNFPPWSDTLQLNHFNPEMRKAMLDELKKISTVADGVRCDMAMLVLNDIFHDTWAHLKDKNVYVFQEEEFWQMVHYSLPELLLVAEAYWDTEWTLQQLGFHYVYDKRLYDRLRYSTLSEVLLHLTADVDFQDRLVRFIENHDEDRSAVVFEKDRLKAAAVLFSTLPGMKLYHHGQLEGRRIKTPLQLRRVMDEIVDAELKEFYEGILSITRQDIFYDGHWRLAEVECSDNECVIAYQWQKQTEFVLIAVNYSSTEGQVFVTPHLPEELNRYVLTNQFYENAEEIRTELDKKDSLSLYMKGYGFAIYYGRIVNLQ